MNVPQKPMVRFNIQPTFRLLLLPTLIAFTLGGCATQEYVHQEVGQYSGQIKNLEAWFNSITQGMDANANRMREAEARISRVEQAGSSLVARLDETRTELNGAGQRMDRLANDLADANRRIEKENSETARAHQRLDGQDARLGSIDRRMEGTRAGLAIAEGRISTLETGVLKSAQITVPGETGSAMAVVPSSTPHVAQPVASPVAQPVAQTIPKAAEANTATVQLDSVSALIAELSRKIEHQSGTLTSVNDRLAGLEAGLSALGQRGQEQDSVIKATNQKLGELQSDISRLRGQGEANAEAITRIDHRVSGVDSELENARGRVEAGEKVLAESGLRLTLVQDLLNKQGELLTRNEIEDGKISSAAQEALDRARQAGKLAEGKLVFETTLTDEVANFGVQETRLNETARNQLKEFADRLKAENRGAFIEIQGYTDSTGRAEANLHLSRERAMAVRDYLHQEAGIPLHLLAVAAYGETRPVADNGTREGRSKNRRVVLVVLR
jgi:peptidoglycan-associated lipoprotein